MDDAATKRHWFRFRLRTLFILMALCGTVGFWIHRQVACQRARDDCQRVLAACEAQTATSRDGCEASLRLYRAEIALPFANRRAAAASHFDRVERIWLISYGHPLSEWMMGVGNDDEFLQVLKQRAEIEAYYRAAARLVGRVVSIAPGVWDEVNERENASSDDP